MLQLLRIIAVVVVVVVFNNGTTVSSESLPYCGYSSNTSKCPGDAVEIRYPFWIENRTAEKYGDCISYPGFQINCAAGRPVINVSNNLYYVLSTDYYFKGGGSLRVVDVDMVAQECPQPRRNISIGSARYSARFLSYYDSRNVDMTFFYNCSTYPENVVQHMPCLDNYYSNSSTTGRRRSFAFTQQDLLNHQFDWYQNCEEAVVVPGPSYNYYGSDSNYTQALKSGFVLYWDYPVNCGNCELSGGKCWANETNTPVTTTPFHCHCPQGMTRLDRICLGPYHESYYGFDIKGQENIWWNKWMK